MSARYVVGLCDEPEWCLMKGGTRYCPPIIREDEQDVGYDHIAFEKARELGREKAVCDFEKGVGGKCAVLLEHDGTHITVYVFDKNGKGKLLERPPYYPYVNDPLIENRGDG